jgi:hypothetical protein
MPDEPLLREKAREAIRSKKLPTRRPDRTFGGAGSGAPCSVCGEPVTPGQMEMEVEYRHEGARVDNYHMHLRCFSAWDVERVATAGETPI